MGNFPADLFLRMILRTEKNIAVAAPEFKDTSSILEKFRAWSKTEGVNVFQFLTTPSAERSALLKTLGKEVKIEYNQYARQFF